MEFASISRTSNCLWSDSPIVTRPGTRLGPCKLRLEQGIALLHFDCDIVVSIEGPCIFEIKNQKRIMLHSGRLVVAALSDEGKGFIVDTPDSRIKDLGTRFAVLTSKDRPSEVYVFDGAVEVQPLTMEKPCLLKQDESLTIGQWSESGNISVFAGEQISTAVGRGKEAWVVLQNTTLETASLVFPKGITDAYMLVKTDEPDMAFADRKAIFTLDLTQLEASRCENFSGATLLLSYGPTEFGYATNVPDATFSVYGLTDEILDSWDESTITWNSFPGNGPRNTLESTTWTRLGGFQIEQGSSIGHVRINGEKLRDFLLADSNGLATFAIVCDTFATGKYSRVFGFANRFHTELQPPRLCFQD